MQVIPLHLFIPPSTSIRGKHMLDPGTAKRGYYAVAHPPGVPAESQLSVGLRRKAWREGRTMSESCPVSELDRMPRERMND